MTRKPIILVVSSLLAAGCIFGGGKNPKVENNDNSETNNGTTATNNGTTTTNNGTTTAMPMSSGDLQELEAVTECTGATRAPIVLKSDVLPGLVDGAIAAVGGAPGPDSLGARDGEGSIAWAHADNGNVVVRAATLVPRDNMTLDSFNVSEPASFSIAAEGEVLEVAISGASAARNAGSSVPLYGVTVYTTEGAHVCGFTVAEWDEAAAEQTVTGMCTPWELVEVAREENVESVHEYALLFELPDFRLNLFNLGDARFFVFAADRQGEASDLAALWFTSAEDVGAFDIEGIGTSLSGGKTFSPYASLGAIEDSYGLPILTVLAGEGEDYGPKVLMANAPVDRANTYELSPLADGWRLLGEERTTDDEFAFVDATTARGNIDFFLELPTNIEIFPEQSEVRFGYLAVSAEPDRLILGVSEPVLGQSHLRVELGAPVQEIVTAPNIVAMAGATSKPFIAIIAGEDRDGLLLGTWDAGDEMTLLDIGNTFGRVNKVTPPPLFYNSGGRVVLSGTHEGDPAIGLLDVDNLTDPQSEYCP